MKRVFFAVPISDEICELLAQIQNDLKDLPGKIRLVPPENVHLTLKFVGEVKPDLVDDLQHAVDEIDLLPPFPVTINRTGVFPHPRRPRVLWVGMEDSPKLAGIANKIDSVFETLGVEPESREFHPHLTLGRVKSRGLPGTTLNQFLNYAVPKLSMQVDRVVCFESKTKRSGAEYTALHETHLQ